MILAMTDDRDAATNREQVVAALDGMQAIARGAYLALVGVVLAVMAPLVFGTQRERLYVTVGAVLLLAWGIGQAFWRLRGLRRTEARVAGDVASGGFDAASVRLSLQHGSGELETIRLDESQVDMAASAAVAGRSWDEICRAINSGYDGMGLAER